MKTFSKAELDAARKRLDEAQGITEEAVEAAARAMYEADEVVLAEGEARQAVPWAKAGEQEHKYRRETARVALRAALPVRPAHFCTTCAQSMCRRRRDIEDACEDPLFPAKAVVVECGAYVADRRVEEVLEHA